VITITTFKPSDLVRELRSDVLRLLYEEAVDHLVPELTMEKCASRDCQICINGLAAMKEAAKRRRF
jgi:hypothetical protein